MRLSIWVVVIPVTIAACERERATGEQIEPLLRLDRVHTPTTIDTAEGPLVVELTEVPAPHTGDFPFGDWLYLDVRQPDGKLIAQHEFYTSYGLFQLDVIQMDGIGLPEFVLISGEGRGTAVREEELAVLSIRHGTFVERLAAPLSGWFGAMSRWWYEYEYVALESIPVVEIHLTLNRTPPQDSFQEYADSIPDDGEVTLTFGSSQP